MHLIDTHSHIYLPEFDADRAEMVARARSAGVKFVVLPNIDSTTTERLHATQEQFPDFCYPLIGLHPTSVKDDYQYELTHLEEQLNQHAYSGIGEIGIDLYWDKTFLSEQKYVFEYQVDIAIKLNLPIIIHCRESFAEITSSLAHFDAKKLKGIFHSFTGTPDEAAKIFSAGDFKLGINGIITYKNATFAQQLQHIPLSAIVLETDAPYLTPVPNRGKRNEPSYVPFVVRKLSEIYQQTEEKIAAITSKNACQVFPNLPCTI
ncbi:MAG: TatD family hydrolase [Paludibacteraceae bacterium]|nr:TatD family hydrolase [Paludibacteraceae bacterium]